MSYVTLLMHEFTRIDLDITLHDYEIQQVTSIKTLYTQLLQSLMQPFVHQFYKNLH
jgi:hypothetical protein